MRYLATLLSANSETALRWFVLVVADPVAALVFLNISERAISDASDCDSRAPRRRKSLI